MDLFICHYFVPSLFLNEANKTSQDRYNFLLSFLYLLGCICKHSTNLLQNKGQLDRLTHAQWLYPKMCTFLWNGRSRGNSWHCKEEVCRWLHCCASPGLPLKIHLNSQLSLTFQSLCKNGKRDFSPSFSSIFFLLELSSNNYVIKDVIKTTWVLTWHPNWEEGCCSPVGPYWLCLLVNIDRLDLVCKKAQWHYVKAEDRSAGSHRAAPRECRCHPAGPRSRLPFRLHFGNTRLENMDALTTNDPSLTFCWSVIARLIVLLFQ